MAAPRRQRCQGPCGKLMAPDDLNTVPQEDGTRKRLCGECAASTQTQLFDQAQQQEDQRRPADPDDVSLADVIAGGDLKPASDGTKRKDCAGDVSNGSPCTLLDGGKPKPALRGLAFCEVHQRTYDAQQLAERQAGYEGGDSPAVAQPAAASGVDVQAGAAAEGAPVLPPEVEAVGIKEAMMAEHQRMVAAGEHPPHLGEDPVEGDPVGDGGPVEVTMYARLTAEDGGPVSVHVGDVAQHLDEGYGLHYADADRLGMQGRPGVVPTVHNIGGEVILSLPALQQVATVPLEHGEEAVFTDNGQGGSHLTVVEPDPKVLKPRPRLPEGVRPAGWPLRKAYISASALSEFARCGESFRRKYVEGIYTASSGSSVTGTAIHAALEHNWEYKMVHQADMTEAELTDLYARAFSQEVKRQQDWNGIEWGAAPDELRAKGQRALVSYLKNVATHVRPVATEESFSLLVPGVPVPVVGVIDLRTQEGRVVDVKSGAKISKQITPDWRMAAMTYLLSGKVTLSVDYHSASYAGSWATPDTEPALRLELTPDTYDVAGRVIAQRVSAILAYAHQFGIEGPWPDGLGHMFACKGCAFKPTCPWWHAQAPAVLV